MQQYIFLNKFKYIINLIFSKLIFFFKNLKCFFLKIYNFLLIVLIQNNKVFLFNILLK